MKSMKIKNNWPVIEIQSVNEFLNEVGKRQNWVFRGQNYHHDLYAQIDRGDLAGIDRGQKIWLEQTSITKFLDSVEYPGDPTEQKIITTCKTDNQALENYRVDLLMIMQHYSVPTRLVDWSEDPNIALYFAVNNNFGNNDDYNGEIWCFDAKQYNFIGPTQWDYKKHPILFTKKDEKFEFDNTLKNWFLTDELEGEWIVAEKMNKDFQIHRVELQKGLFTITSKFDRDHAVALQRLFTNDSRYYCRLVIDKNIKSKLRDYLGIQKIWGGSLFSDPAGVANALRKDIFDLD